jgi:hypothetical protein
MQLKDEGFQLNFTLKFAFIPIASYPLGVHIPQFLRQCCRIREIMEHNEVSLKVSEYIF